MTKRDTYVDVAKGICILLVVCIHTEVFGVIGMPLVFIAVPMFFFMSGFYDHSDRSMMEWLPKSLRTLLLPAVIWNVIASIYLTSLRWVKGDTEILDSIFTFDIYNPFSSNGPAWFLVALLYVKFFVWGLTRGGKDNKYLILIVTCLMGYVGSKYQLPLLIDEGLAAVPLYLLGKITYPKMMWLQKNPVLTFAGIMTLLLFLSGYIYYTITPTSNGCYYPYYLISLACVVTLFVFILRLCTLQKISFLEKLGNDSLGIMLLHCPMCHTAAVFLNRIFEKGSLIWIVTFLLFYIVIVFLSYIGTLFIKKSCPVLFGRL